MTDPTSGERHQRTGLTWLAAVLLVVLALVPRIGFLLTRGIQRTDDTVSYLTIAENLREQRAFSLRTEPPFSPTIRRSPAYPWFLAAVGPKEPARVVLVQALLDSLVAAAVFFLARSVAGGRWAFLAGLIYAAHPGAILASASLLSESLFTVLLVFAVLAFVRGLEQRQGGHALLGGVLLGLAALCRPFVAPFLLALPLAALLLGKTPGRWRPAAAFAAAGLLTVTPWIVRSSHHAGGFVLIQGYSAENLYLASRSDWTQGEMTRERMEEDVYFQRLYASKDDPQAIRAADRLGMQLAAERISAAPLEFVAERAQRWPYLVLNSFDETTGVDRSFGDAWRERDYEPLGIKIGLLLVFAALPLLAGVLAIPHLRRSPALLLCTTTWLLTLVIHLPLRVEPRSWWPVVPLLLVSGAGGLAARRRTARAAAAGR